MDGQSRIFGRTSWTIPHGSGSFVVDSTEGLGLTSIWSGYDRRDDLLT